MKQILLWNIIAFTLLFAGVYFYAPRERVDMKSSFDESKIGNDIDAYLAREESQFSDIAPGVQKRVIWAGARNVKTPLSVVYLHGFSATSQEIRPVPDQVAKALGANLLYTRLRGHGRGGAAMAGATAGDWLYDTAEALTIGRRIGDRVVVISTSTGGTLAAIAATDPALAKDLKGIVFISPNFGLQNRAAFMLTWPLARYWLPVIIGPERGFEPANPAHARYWTARYPTVALLPMAALVKVAAALDYSHADMPAMFIISDRDQVVRADITRAIAARWGTGGARVLTLTPGPGDDPNGHVIAGDIMSPGLTAPVSRAIIDWLRAP